MKILAHRGYSGKYPENTMTAFKEALKAGADGIELDVQLTKDGQVVIIHDEKVDRTTDGQGWVKDFTLEEIKKLNANRTKPESIESESIPSFDEYCKWAADNTLITNVELKTGKYYYRGLEEKTLEIVRKHGIEDRIIFSSFNPLSVYKIKQLAPEIPCGLLAEYGGIEMAGDLCSDFGFEYYHPSKDELTEENIENCNERGIGLNVWTVNDQDKFLWCKKIKVNSVITNYPETFVNQIKNCK